MLNEEIDLKFNPMSSWAKLKKSEYVSFGIADMPEAKVVCAYNAGRFLEGYNVVVVYDYGKNENFFEELSNGYATLNASRTNQDELGIVPIYWKSNNKLFLSVIKVISNPTFQILDLFFDIEGEIYCVHTYIPKEEKDFSFENLANKYKYFKKILENVKNL